jgi:hypothetical protein
VGFGKGGLSLLICAHKGFVCCASRSAKSACPASLLALVVISISVEVIIADGATLKLYKLILRNQSRKSKIERMSSVYNLDLHI